jgi:4-aminobutyrate aminotransferase-like enzyme
MAGIPAAARAVPGPGPGRETVLTGRTWIRGRGALLIDDRGLEHVDLGSGGMTQLLGHTHPSVVAAVRQQAQELENVHDCPTPARDRAEAALRRLLPSSLTSIAFFNTGSEAVEAAVRLVAAQAPPGRRRIAALRRGFHGKTRGSRSLVMWDVGTEPASAATLGYPAYCYRCPFGLTYPRCDVLCARLTVAQVISRPDVAALFAEPVPGAAGVLVPPPEYWPIVAAGCQQYDVMLVADEVLTGGGRVGAFLAASVMGFEPDIVTLAKGLASGYPVAAVAATTAAGTAESWAAAGGTSTTYGGSGVPLAAAAATLTELANMPPGVGELFEIFAAGLDRIGRAACVGEVRYLGLLGAIEVVHDRASRRPSSELADRIVTGAMARGVRVLPGGNVLRLAPPLVIEPGQLRDALDILADVVTEVSAQ